MKKVIFIGDTVNGMAGKSTFAKLIKVSEKEVDIISLDALMIEALRLIVEKPDGKLDTLYPQNRDFLTKVLSKRIPEELEKVKNELVIVEGIYAEGLAIIKDLGYPILNITLINQARIKGEMSIQLAVNNKLVEDYDIFKPDIYKGEERKTEQELEEYLKANESVIKQLITELKEKSSVFKKFTEEDVPDINEILDKIHYQSFEIFDKQGTSKSSDKFKPVEALIPNVKDAKILDVGCNTGYFAFKSTAINPTLEFTCLDMDSQVIDIANQLNDYHFHYPSITFLNQDIFDFEGGGFDMIMSFSVFHYFRKRQKEFIELVHKKLEPKGAFFAEFGYTKDNEDQEHIEVYQRFHNEEAVYYPNRLTIQRWLVEAGFIILSCHASPSQGNDKNPRVTYLAQKA